MFSVFLFRCALRCACGRRRSRASAETHHKGPAQTLVQGLFSSCVGILLSVFLFSSVAQTLDELMFLADLPPPVFLDF